MKFSIDFSDRLEVVNLLLQLVCAFRQQELGLVGLGAFCGQQPVGFVDFSRSEVAGREKEETFVCLDYGKRVWLDCNMSND